jgi:putative spermidine/putrescine transport system substrate-binding protein
VFESSEMAGRSSIPRRARSLSIALAVVALAACAGGPATAEPWARVGYEQFQPDESLLRSARAEGTITTIALPHDWCGYREVIDTFRSRFAIAVNEREPDASSGQELDAITPVGPTVAPDTPDVVDVGLSFGIQAKEDGLLQPYKVGTWATIPAAAKDSDGFWYGDYFGVLAFEVNTAFVKDVPRDWADLLKPEYKGQVALAGDPRRSNQAIQTVFAAALANGGSLDDATAGLDFFRNLVEVGNFVPVIAGPATIASGTTPITIRWTYNALSNRDIAAGNPPIEVVVPRSGRFAGTYVQAIAKVAPHPNAARLWMEFLYSDEGQNIWLRGYCHPIRFDDLTRNNRIPPEQLARLPDVKGAVFPTIEQVDKATELISKRWDSVIGLEVR